MMSGCRSCSDRLFHSVGPAAAKQQSPNWLRDLLTKHVRLSTDRRGQRPAALNSVHSSARYRSDGEQYTILHLRFSVNYLFRLRILFASYSSVEPYCHRWEVCEVRCSRVECIPDCNLFLPASSSDHALQNTRRRSRLQDQPFSSPPRPTACTSVKRN